MANRNALIRHAKRGFEILRRQGPKAFINKVKLKMAERNYVYVPPMDEKILSYDELDGFAKSILANVPSTEDNSKFLAVQLHLYYEDLLDEFVENLSHIPMDFDLFISVRESVTDPEESASGEATDLESRITAIKAKCQQIPHLGKVEVCPTENRGRDIAPMYVLFGQEVQQYKYALHMHSKKSLYTGGEQMNWRQYSVKTLIGAEDQVARLLGLMEEDPTIGIVYPERFEGMPAEAYAWLANESKGKDFLESIGVPFRGGIFLYPLGSFFIVRNEAISQIWNRKLTYQDFDEEAGQTDGTLAHILERAISHIVRFNGFHEAIVADARKEVHVDADKHSFAPVFARDQKTLLMDLEAYDVVSFDIFDTLLTRAFYHPVDLFSYIEAQTNMEGFARTRLAAEQDAMKIYGAKMTIQEIYLEVGKQLGLSENQCQELLNLEVDLEMESLLPRRDMVDIYQKLVDAGKEVILVSDMYLTKEILQKVLAKNTITGYSKFYLSCEEDARKDDGTLWDQVLKDYAGKNIAHVGDNLQSDWQVLASQQQKSVWIMNPRDEEKIAAIAKLGQAKHEFHENQSETHSKSVESIVEGLAMNAGAFNSPFALSPDGNLHFDDPYTLGFTVFGPLMYEFMVWLHETTPDDANLALLAREGYIFQQVYEAIYKDHAKDHTYLLASRRAISVAAIRSVEDIKEICRRDYDGTLRNLVTARLGGDAELVEHLPDKILHFKLGEPDDYDAAMKILEPYFEQMIAYAAKEREDYLAYFDQAIPKERRASTVYVDIGYAGTIQYYLSKLLEEPVTGEYMAVFKPNEKLAEMNCPVHAMYLTGRDDFAGTIDMTQLFLESVLQAPYGQLLKFVDGQPVYRDEAMPSAEIQELQRGIVEYAKKRSSLEYPMFTEVVNSEKIVDKTADVRDNSVNAEKVHRISTDPGNYQPASKHFMEQTYDLFLNGPYISEKLAGIFSVEDNYSQDTTLHYDAKSHRWVI